MIRPWEDPRPFLADFAERVITPDGVTFRAIIDYPTAYDEVGDGSTRIVSGETLMRFATRDAKLRRGDQVIIRGRRYRLREHPVRTGDGAFSEVLLGGDV